MTSMGVYTHVSRCYPLTLARRSHVHNGRPSIDLRSDTDIVLNHRYEKLG